MESNPCSVSAVSIIHPLGDSQIEQVPSYSTSTYCTIISAVQSRQQPQSGYTIYTSVIRCSISQGTGDSLRTHHHHRRKHTASLGFMIGLFCRFPISKLSFVKAPLGKLQQDLKLDHLISQVDCEVFESSIFCIILYIPAILSPFFPHCQKTL